MSLLDGVRDVGEAVVPIATEDDMAALRAQQGWRVVEHRGRSWMEGPKGLFRPVHLAARLTAHEATRPAAACWGFRAGLTDDDAHLANGAIPIYLVSDLDSFEESRLTSDRRRRLRMARKNADLVQLTGPDLLAAQGYDLLTSMHSRTGYGKLPAREKYLAGLGHLGDPAKGIVLGALFDGRLGGYLTGYAVDGTAYADEIVVASWALKTHISAGLTYEFLYACRRSAGIREMLHGGHAPENEGLCRNKELLGLPLHLLPARVSLLPGLAPVLRRYRPLKYYRLTGNGPYGSPAGVPAPPAPEPVG